ncbi:putative bifunctional diguanylate cyclase/phosphodiesterase [Butyrivibrio sp. YAB3001]|uniref:putative bifunctional diguanylate cyclase/phosphodiesterase n=1 Tax=Butyrivibrio sp. YAB3001 TaxID=1520812 RepID=UPI0008F6373B|nr:EAL domain-containing protein [Butyrivibrio sp. YAB3001]SFB73311.1 diguanylate cyclase (GGDEF) domain-containing protein [Butyrivibrio sp. YAB3001]
MTFERSFANFVQILSEEELTPEISPGALSDISKEYSLRSIVAVISFFKESDQAGEPDVVIPLFGPVQEKEAPDYLFKHNVAGKKTVTYNIYLYDGKSWNEEEYKSFAIVMDILIIHMERFLLEKAVKDSALTQYLTGLPNSGGFIAYATKLFESREIMGYDAFYFNLKSYGLISRRYGLSEGDEIMKRYAKKLKAFCDKGEMVAHFGGDNYTALIKKERTREFLDFLSSVPVYGIKNGKREELHIAAVIGVYAVDESLKEPGQLISRAGMALSYAKNVANKPYVFVNKAMSTRIYRQKQIEDRYEEALANDEFRIYLQPKVDLFTGELIGAESLVRWFCNGIVLYPAEFIPILEQEGMVATLDLYVLKKTCEFIKGWKENGIEPVPVSVNFSRRDLNFSHLAREIVRIIDETGIDRKWIQIEVTETANEDERLLMTNFLISLKEKGIDTAIDDFGTGYSSLSSLRDFPVNVIKIDRSFINNESVSENDEIVLKNIVRMAEELNIKVLTEGVEKPEQVDLLKSVGCHYAQGFLYDNPMPENDFQKRLIKRVYSE